MKQQRGFGIIGIVIVLCCLGLIVGAGYLVYARQHTKSTSNSQPTTTTEKPTSTDTAAPAPEKQHAVADPNANNNLDFDITHIVASYTLPTKWQYLPCKDTVRMLVPDGMAVPDCHPDQPNTPLTVSVQVNYFGIDTQSCATTDKKVDKASDGFVSYACQDITIDGKKGIKQITTMKKPNFYDTAYVQTDYTFATKDGGLLMISYVMLDGTKDYTAGFDNFAYSLKFVY